MSAPSLLGKSVSRVEGRSKVTGSALYTADRHLSNAAHGVLVVSTIGKGRIVSMDETAAKAAPGVLAVLTASNMPKLNPLPEDITGPDKPGERRVPLEDNIVHHYGQQIGFVVAETLEQAQQAVHLLNIKYEEKRPALHFEQAESTAFEPDAFFGEKELQLQVQRGDIAHGLAAAAASVDLTYETPVLSHQPLEMGATVAHWQNGRLTVYESTRWIEGTQRMVSHMLDLPLENVHVVCPFIGGAFGSKGFFWGHCVLTAVAARQVNRPVKMVMTRQQIFTSLGRRPRTVQQLTLGCDKHGKLLALRHLTTNDTSPYSNFVEPCGLTSRSLYSSPNVEVRHRVVRLNASPPTFMRAPGEASGSFALESALDELAYEAGVDPLELRLRSYAETDENRGTPYSSKHLRECYKQAAERFGWSRRNREPRSMKDGDALLGWGMATAAYPARRPPGAAKITLFADGTALVTSATHDFGNGTYTSMTQVAADRLELPIKKVRFELGDSDFPVAPVSGGSWTSTVVGSAITAAATQIKEKLTKLATDHGTSLDAAPEIILRQARLNHIEVVGEAKSGEEREKYSFESFGAVFIEVKVRETEPVQVTRVTAAYDVGSVLNPKLANSQIVGGLIFGIGMALVENTVYESRHASILNANLAEYEILTHSDIPLFDVILLGKPDPFIDPMGSRGLGEIGITGVVAAVANAVFHATGRRIRQLPITTDKLV